MQCLSYAILSVFLFLFIQPSIGQQTRDPYKQPFAENSIWNTPIGDQAIFVPAGLGDVNGIHADEDYIVLTPDAPITPILESSAGWSTGGVSRCDATGALMQQVPMPKHFVISPDNWIGRTPNAGLAALLTDGETIIQNQPFARCNPGAPGTTKYNFSQPVNIFGDGRYGAHGGSRLSAIGGAIRIGELVPGGEINHVLKMNVFARLYLSYNQEHKGFRWPAFAADSYAGNATNGYGGTVDETRMGSLLALPASVEIESLGLQTEPARILARTLQLYGAYIVDDTAWDQYALITEFSPEGRVKDEFEMVWGFPFNISDKSHPWLQDLDTLFKSLHVVENNSELSIGGGGNPVGPLPLEFGRAGNKTPFVNLVSPSDYQAMDLGDNIVILVEATDVDGEVSHVEFYAGSDLIGVSNTEPYSIDWEVDREGSFILLAKAFDNEGGVGLSQGVRLVSAPDEVFVPSVTITSPVSGVSEDDGSVIALTADIESDGLTVQKVEWYLNGYKYSTKHVSPFSAELTYLAVGEYIVRARVFAGTDISMWSQPVYLTVEHLSNHNPVVYMASPADGAVFNPNATVVVHARAYDPETAIKSVELYVNDVLLNTNTLERYRHTWRSSVPGSYTIHAIAEDMDGGRTTSSPVIITIAGDVSVDEVSEFHNRVYPNPVGRHEILQVKIAGYMGNVMVSLVDLTGKVVYSSKFSGDDIAIDMNKTSVERGYYFLKMEISGQQPLIKNIVVF